jgi:hypothetical protein
MLAGPYDYSDLHSAGLFSFHCSRRADWWRGSCMSTECIVLVSCISDIHVQWFTVLRVFIYIETIELPLQLGCCVLVPDLLLLFDCVPVSEIWKLGPNYDYLLADIADAKFNTRQVSDICFCYTISAEFIARSGVSLWRSAADEFWSFETLYRVITIGLKYPMIHFYVMPAQHNNG